VTRVRSRGERGAATLEIAILTPAIMLVIAFVVLAGRYANANGDVLGAARDAARAASLEDSQGAAEGAAVAAVQRALETDGYRCIGGAQTSVPLYVAPALGSTEPGRVRVRVSCRVTFADLGMPLLPGARTITEDSLEVIDVYRSR
jgi:Flp pilus assembly protein TadG